MDRLSNNLKCLNFLKEILEDNPGIRIEQLLHLLDGTDDWFYEEPTKTLKRWKDTFSKI